MNKERMAYIAPTSELLVVRFEQNIMSPLYGGDNAAGRGFTSGDSIIDETEDY